MSDAEEGLNGATRGVLLGAAGAEPPLGVDAADWWGGRRATRQRGR